MAEAAVNARDWKQRAVETYMEGAELDKERMFENARYELRKGLESFGIKVQAFTEQNGHLVALVDGVAFVEDWTGSLAVERGCTSCGEIMRSSGFAYGDWRGLGYGLKELDETAKSHRCPSAQEPTAAERLAEAVLALVRESGSFYDPNLSDTVS